MPTNCLSVFDHFGKLAFKALRKNILNSYKNRWREINVWMAIISKNFVKLENWKVL